MSDEQPRIISRRDLLRGVGVAAVAAAAPAAPALAERCGRAGGRCDGRAGRHERRAAREAYENLTATEADTLEAIVARLIPTDANGPGATEARAVHYIDRALGGALASSRQAYSAGFAAFDRYCRMSRGKPFVELSPTDQDSVLIDVESGSATGSGAGFAGSSAQFFGMVLNHTRQGTFGDPYYGGNANFVGWDLIGYPGVRTTVSAGRSAGDGEGRAQAQSPIGLRHRDVQQGHRAERSRRSTTMATRLQDTDVVVVGLGAAGGVAVLPLTQAGIEVVGLEAGTRLTRRDFAPDEIRNNVRDWPMAVQKANQEVPTSRATASSPTTRGAGHPMMNGVGGTTLHYWAQSWRLNPWDFKVVSETKRRYGASRIPKGSTVEDWPFGYEELEPYYDKVEYEVGVSGQAGNVNGKIDPKGNLFEGPRKRPLPDAAAALDRVPREDGRRRRDRSAGIRSPARPRSTRGRTRTDRRACITASATAGGCHVDAKNSTAVTTIPRARGDGQAEGRHARARDHHRVDAQGRVTGVNYLVDGTEYFQPAKVVLLASYTYENTRLLLLSKSKAYPNGLSNNHGQVGRHYFSHHQGAPVSALFPFNLHSWYGLPAQGVAVDDFADDNFDHAGLDFIGGGNLWVYSDRRPIGGRRHEHVRPRARVGIRVEGVHQGERRSVEQRLHPEDDAAVRRQLPRSRSAR